MRKIIFLIILSVILLCSYALSWQVEFGSVGNELELTLTGHPGNVPLAVLSVTVKSKPEWITFSSDSSIVKEVEELITIPAYTDSLGEYHSEKDIIVKKNISRFTFDISSKANVGAKGNILLIVKDDKGRSWNKNIDVEVVSESTKQGNVRPSIGEKVFPAEFELSQNYPNPFNPETNISYALPVGGYVKLNVYSTTGQLVKKLVGEFKDAGYYIVKWNGQDEQGRTVSNGVYVYKIEFQSDNSHLEQIKRAVMLK
jgi:hypothetical protein